MSSNCHSWSRINTFVRSIFLCLSDIQSLCRDIPAVKLTQALPDRRSWRAVIRRSIAYDIFAIYVCCYEDCYKIGLTGIRLSTVTPVRYRRSLTSNHGTILSWDFQSLQKFHSSINQKRFMPQIQNFKIRLGRLERINFMVMQESSTITSVPLMLYVYRAPS